jgi:hypothetical protein
MRNTPQTMCEQDEQLNTLAAELTVAAYPIALKYGVAGSSLDLELEIWKTFVELLHRRSQQLPQLITVK